MAQERLNKVMANAGIASRRACDEMIQAGRVTVNGRVVTELGVKVDPRLDQIRVDGEVLKPRPAGERRSYLMLYKPAGVLSVFDDPRGRPGLESLLKGPLRLFPVGRLDMDSEGLLLLTDDGDLTLKLSHPRFEHAKTYLVLVDRAPGSDTLARYRRGIQLDDGVTAPSQWRVLEHPALVPPPADPAAAEGVWLHVTMHEGRKRQIRRMAAAENMQVRRLVRVSLGSLRLDRKLKPGESRPLNRREIEQLQADVRSQPPAAVPRRRKEGGREASRAGAAQHRSPRRDETRTGPRPGGPRPGEPRGPRRDEGRPGPRPGAPRRAEPAERAGEPRGPRRDEGRPGPPSRGAAPGRGPTRRGPSSPASRPAAQPSGGRAPGRQAPDRADAPASDDRPGRVRRRPATTGKPRPGGRPSGRKPGSGGRPAGKKTGKR